MLQNTPLPGSFYRNKLGGIVLLVGAVIPDTKPYEQGFRFMDHRGSYYTDVGTVQNRIFESFDLVEEVEPRDVPEETMLKIRELTNKLVEGSTPSAKVYKLARKVLPVAAGVNLTLGALVVRANPIIGGISLIAGTAGVVMHALYPEELV